MTSLCHPDGTRGRKVDGCSAPRGAFRGVDGDFGRPADALAAAARARPGGAARPRRPPPPGLAGPLGPPRPRPPAARLLPGHRVLAAEELARVLGRTRRLC